MSMQPENSVFGYYEGGPKFYLDTARPMIVRPAISSAEANPHDMLTKHTKGFVIEQYPFVGDLLNTSQQWQLPQGESAVQRTVDTDSGLGINWDLILQTQLDKESIAFWNRFFNNSSLGFMHAPVYGNLKSTLPHAKLSKEGDMKIDFPGGLKIYLKDDKCIARDLASGVDIDIKEHVEQKGDKNVLPIKGSLMDFAGIGAEVDVITNIIYPVDGINVGIQELTRGFEIGPMNDAAIRSIIDVSTQFIDLRPEAEIAQNPLWS